MRKSSSGCGLFQFSLLKQKRVSWWMPSREHSSTIVLTVCMPCEWPSTLGKPLSLAHLPLPSIIIAMCAGSLEGSSPTKGESALDVFGTVWDLGKEGTPATKVVLNPTSKNRLRPFRAYRYKLNRKFKNFTDSISIFSCSGR